MMDDLYDLFNDEIESKEITKENSNISMKPTGQDIDYLEKTMASIFNIDYKDFKIKGINDDIYRGDNIFGCDNEDDKDDDNSRHPFNLRYFDQEDVEVIKEIKDFVNQIKKFSNENKLKGTNYVKVLAPNYKNKKELLYKISNALITMKFFKAKTSGEYFRGSVSKENVILENLNNYVSNIVFSNKTNEEKGIERNSSIEKAQLVIFINNVETKHGNLDYALNNILRIRESKFLDTIILDVNNVNFIAEKDINYNKLSLEITSKNNNTINKAPVYSPRINNDEDACFVN